MSIITIIKNLFHKNLEPEGTETVTHDTVMVLENSKMIEVTEDDT